MPLGDFKQKKIQVLLWYTTVFPLDYQSVTIGIPFVYTGQLKWKTPQKTQDFLWYTTIFPLITRVFPLQFTGQLNWNNKQTHISLVYCCFSTGLPDFPVELQWNWNFHWLTEILWQSTGIYGIPVINIPDFPVDTH